MYIWAKIHALRQAKAIKRLKYAFRMFASAEFTVIEGGAKHISMASKENSQY